VEGSSKSLTHIQYLNSSKGLQPDQFSRIYLFCATVLTSSEEAKLYCRFSPLPSSINVLSSCASHSHSHHFWYQPSFWPTPQHPAFHVRHGFLQTQSCRPKEWEDLRFHSLPWPLTPHPLLNHFRDIYTLIHPYLRTRPHKRHKRLTSSSQSMRNQDITSTMSQDRLLWRVGNTSAGGFLVRHHANGEIWTPTSRIRFPIPKPQG
jgi:hypothetical protein